MKDSNKCESPLGGWFAECDRFDKNGNHSVGIGKAVADVTYYNQSQGRDNEFTYQMCEECTKMYKLMIDVNDYEDNVVVAIQYYDKNHKGSFDNRKTTVFV